MVLRVREERNHVFGEEVKYLERWDWKKRHLRDVINLTGPIGIYILVLTIQCLTYRHEAGILIWQRS